MISKLRSPVYAQVEITSACNNKCKYCYNFWRDPKQAIKRSDLTMNQLKKIAEVLGKNDVFYVTVTGGEPFLYKKKLYYFLDCLVRQNIKVMINSNATLIDKKDARILAGYPLDIFLASIISHDAEQHDIMANTRGSHQKTVNGIKILLEYGIATAVNMVATKLNYKEVYATGKWLHNYLGITNFSATPICPSTNSHLQLTLDNREIFEVLNQLLILKRELGLHVDILEVMPTCLFTETDNKELVEIFSTRICTAGNTTITIGSEGDVRVCSYDQRSYGNILQENFPTIWSRMEEWRNNSLLPKECKDCLVVESCGGGCKISAQVKKDKNCKLTPIVRSVIKERGNAFFSNISSDIDMNAKFRLVKNISFREEKRGIFLIVANPMQFVIVNKDGASLIQRLAALNCFTPNEAIDIMKFDSESAKTFFAELRNKNIIIKA